MSKAEETYRSLEKELVRIRWVNFGRESSEEDACLDLMDVAWSALTDEERDAIERQPPQSLIRRSETVRSRAEDIDVSAFLDQFPRSRAA